MDKEQLQEYLIWLVTPQNDGERDLMREEGLIDDYIELVNRIPKMSFSDLICEINIQLAPYNKSLELLPV